MKYPTTWVRQKDGGYSRSGQLEKNTRRVQITIADGDSFGHYRPGRAVEIIEQAIASGHVRAERYSIVPAADEKRKMPEAVREFLSARRADPHKDDALYYRRARRNRASSHGAHKTPVPGPKRGAPGQKNLGQHNSTPARA